MVDANTFIERKRLNKRFLIAACLGLVFTAITFVNWGWIYHPEGMARSYALMIIAAATNILLIIVYRQMVKGWKLEDEQEAKILHWEQIVKEKKL